MPLCVLHDGAAIAVTQLNAKNRKPKEYLFNVAPNDQKIQI
jgi:hypothetical protein